MKVGFVYEVLEVRLLGHRRLANVIVGRDAVVVRQLGQLPHIVHVVAADVDVEEHRVAVLVLLLHQVIEVLRMGTIAFGNPLPGTSSHASTARLTVATPASATLSITSGHIRRPLVGR